MLDSRTCAHETIHTEAKLRYVSRVNRYFISAGLLTATLGFGRPLAYTDFRIKGDILAMLLTHVVITRFEIGSIKSYYPCHAQPRDNADFSPKSDLRVKRPH